MVIKSARGESGKSRKEVTVRNLGSMLFCSFFGWTIFLVCLMIIKNVRGETGKSIREVILNNLGSRLFCSSFGWNFSVG